MNTSTSDIGSPSERDSDAVSVVDKLVLGLTAYRQAVQLYADDHPRVRARVQQLYEDLEQFMELRKKVFVVHVREGTLFSGNRPLPQESGAVGRFAALLRERMIQLLQLSPGVTREEITAFISVLLQDPQDLLVQARRYTKIGAHITLYHFGHFFGEDEPVTEEEIIAGAQDTAALLGEVGTTKNGRSRWSASDWITFDREQLHAIARVVQREPLRSRIEDVRTRHGLDRGSRDFLPTFLEILRRDSQVNWGDQESLTELIAAGLLILDMASQSVSDTDRVPDSLVMDATSPSLPLDPHARWRLIHTFFPGMYRRRTPLEDENDCDEGGLHGAPIGGRSDFDLQNKGGRWSLTEVPEEEWGGIEPERLSEDLTDQFDEVHLLGECSAMLEELKNLDSELPSGEIRRNLLDALTRDLSMKQASRDELEALLEGCGRLPPDAQRAWRADLACALSPPEEFLLDLCDRDSQRLEKLLSSPPPNLEEETAGDRFLPEAREALRQVFLRRDAFAISVLMDAINRISALGGSPRWAAVARQICSGNPALAGWVSAHVDELITPDASMFLLAILDDDVLASVRRRLDQVGGHHFLPTIRKIGARKERAARRLLHFALDSDNPALRTAAITALGRHGDGESTRVLSDLLEQANEEDSSREDVDSVCGALARNEFGKMILLRILSERKLVCFSRWKRMIRDASKAAMRRATREESLA